MPSRRATRTISYIPYSFVPNHTATIEALARSKLSGRQFRMVLFIMRQTDGYLRNEDRISPTFFARNTGISKGNVPRILASLKKLKIITILPGRPPTYSVNPPGHWDRSVLVKNDEENSSDSTRNLVKNDEKHSHTKDNLKITNKEYRDRYNLDPEKFTRGKYGHLVKR